MSDVSTTDELAKRLVERIRQNPLRRTRGARDFAELEDEIDRLHAENTALKSAVERVRALHEGEVMWYPDWDDTTVVCPTCNTPLPCPTLRALEEAP